MSSKKNTAVIKHPELLARLRRERELLQQEARQEGRGFARGWAVNAADERELRNVAGHEWDGSDEDELDTLMKRNPNLDEAIRDAAAGDPEWARFVEEPCVGAFVKGLVEGAREIWSEVAPHLSAAS